MNKWNFTRFNFD